MAAEIAYDYSHYLGKYLYYPFDKKIFDNLPKVGYPVVIDILIFILNLTLLILGLYNSFGLYTSNEFSCIAIFSVLLTICIVFKGFLKYELNYLHDSIVRYIDSGPFLLSRKKQKDIKKRYKTKSSEEEVENSLCDKAKSFKKNPDYFLVLTLVCIIMGVIVVIAALVKNLKVY